MMRCFPTGSPSRFWQVSWALLLCGWVWLLSGIPAHADESRILKVTGQGMVNVETSIAMIRLGVTVNGASAQKVQAEVAQRSNQLVDKLKQLQVEKLQTTGISLNPQFDYKDGQAKQTGVIGQNSVQFEVPINKAGSVLDQAVGAGATQVESVSFKAEDPVMAAGRKSALQLAVKDAQKQAQDVLQTLSLTIKSVERIQVNATNAPPQPIALRQSNVAYSSASAPTPVVGGDQSITATVTMDFSY